MGKLPSHPYFTLKSGHCTILGKRPSNEDAHVVEDLSFFLKDSERKFTVSAVFDGHGGSQAADFCAEHFKEYL